MNIGRLVITGLLMMLGVSAAGCADDFCPDCDVPDPGYHDSGLPDYVVSDVSGVDSIFPPDQSSWQDVAPVDVEAVDANSPPPVIDSIDPAGGDPDGPTTVTITGSGLSDVVDVWFGRARSPSVFVFNDVVLNCVAPPARSGPVKVKVVDSSGREATAPVDFVYSGRLRIDSLSPVSGTTDGGTPVVVRGAGFLSGPEVYFNDRPAVSVTVAGDNELLVVTPPGTAGKSDVRLVDDSDESVLFDAWEYVQAEVPPAMSDVVVSGVSPSSGPPQGGNRVLIVGSGFFQGLSVRIGALPATSVNVLSETMIEATVPAGSPGFADVSVSYMYWRNTLKDGYFYRGSDGGTSGIFSIDPPDASWSGGSLVTIRGFGLSGMDTVWFGEYAGTVVEHVSDFELLVKTPRSEKKGRVFVMLLGSGGTMVEDAFRFYDPFITGGGAGGGFVDRNVNVTVYSGSTGLRLAGAYVILGSDMHTPFQGRTDDRGQITFSDPGLSGPVQVSATVETFTAATYAGMDARDVTLSIYSSPSPETPTEGGPSEPSTPCSVSGRVLDYGKYFIKPLWLDGSAWVECFTSTSSMYTSLTSIPESNRPDENGRFTISARNGEFAVICRLMVQETGAGDAWPLRMGAARHVRCTDGVAPAVELSLDIPTDSSVRFGLSGIPWHPLGTWEPRFTGGWHLGSDGYLPLPSRGKYDGAMTLFENLPPLGPDSRGEGTDDLAGEGFDLYVSVSSKDTSGLPYSVVQQTGVQVSTAGALFSGVPPNLETIPIGISRGFTAFRLLKNNKSMALDDSGRTWIRDESAFVAGQVVLNRRANDFIGDTEFDFTAVGSNGRIFEVRNGVVTMVQTPFVADFLSIDGSIDGEQSIVTQSALLSRQDGIISVESIPSGSQISAVRRFDDGMVVAVGPDGQIVLGTSGETFSAVRPVAEDLYAVAGASSERVWIAGENGRVISIIDGDVTVLKTPGTESLRGIVELSECSVVFYGDSCAIYHFDCFRFTDIRGDRADGYAISGGVADDSTQGGVLLISSPVTSLESFAGFPLISNPVDQTAWDGREITWASGFGWGATHCQGLITGPLGYSFWQFTVAGDLGNLTLPDFRQAIGYTPNMPGPRKINLTCSRSPSFNIDNFDYRSLSSSGRATWSVDLAVFF